MNLNSKTDYSMLRKGKASELVAGGVWYLKKGEKFELVITNILQVPNLTAYRKFVKEQSVKGNLYLRRDKPNYPLTKESECFTKQRIKENEQFKR